MTKYNVTPQDDFLLGQNLLGATTIEELEQLEKVAFYLQASKLEKDGYEFLIPIHPETIKELHYYLFRNIYRFAGQFRTVELMKESTRFCRSQYISENLNGICKEMNEEKQWSSVEEASARLAYFKTELNMIHPFREGNGRIIRLIIREFSRLRGYEWQFEKLNPHEYMEAMVCSVNDESKLEKLFSKTLYKTN